MYQPAEAPSQMPTHTRDHRYGYSPDPPVQMDRPDDFSAQGTTDGYCISLKNNARKGMFCVNVCIVQTNRSSVQAGTLMLLLEV